VHHLVVVNGIGCIVVIQSCESIVNWARDIFSHLVLNLELFHAIADCRHLEFQR
jgi:hypothetical protein